MKDNLIKDLSFDFALDIVACYKYLCENKKEYVLSKQLLRSGTSIGSNVREADLAISKKEFIVKAQIALKEASETEYWILLLIRGGYLPENTSFLPRAQQLIRVLTSIIKSAKENLEKNKSK